MNLAGVGRAVPAIYSRASPISFITVRTLVPSYTSVA